MLAYAKSDIGLVRKTNEDSYIFAPPCLYAVADGMGGHEAGEIASSLAVSTLHEYIGKNSGVAEPQKMLRDAIYQANRIIFEMSQQRPECSGMGTTITAVLIEDNTVFWGHVGDSRLYLLREGSLQQLTQDHSLVWELMQHGSITPDEAHTHPHRNILTRAVGTADMLQIDCGCVKCRAGDQLLLATDGLTSMLTDLEIRDILLANMDIALTVDKLVERANAAGGLDNITVVLLRCGS
ncbi:MAG: Stp1/IreP family PP2C-type Ser/Thr phosphatase [Negativicutes bacterium]|nr:Stp1/IreP family PP2C-type Ser/Thr phosphatase [Negativicutes bacterium]